MYIGGEDNTIYGFDIRLDACHTLLRHCDIVHVQINASEINASDTYVNHLLAATDPPLHVDTYPSISTPPTSIAESSDNEWPTVDWFQPVGGPILSQLQSRV